MSGKGAAPDVDLRSRGTSSFTPLVLGAAAAGLAAFYYSRDPTQEQSVYESGFWTLIWIFYRLFQMVAGLALMLLLVLVVRQRSILYVPVPPNTARSPGENPVQLRTPDQHPWNMDYENVMIPTEDGLSVNTWFIYHRAEALQNKVPYTVVYFHGNAGNIGFRLENLRDMHKKLQLNILILDYRNYGDSDDSKSGPTEAGFMIDAKAAYRWLIDRIHNPPKNEKTRMSADKILLFGRSIGGAVALKLGALLLEERLAAKAAGKPMQPIPAGFVLENTFTSLRDMAVQVFPFLYYLKPILRSPLVFDEWKGNAALDYMVQNHEHWCCCLLSGQKDTLVPPAQMQSLHELMKRRPPKVLKYFKFPEGGHNDTPMKGGVGYWNSFQKFLDLVEDSEPDRKAFFASQQE